MTRLLFFLIALSVQSSLFGQNGITQSAFIQINSSLDEQKPVISQDGSALYFTIGNHPQNMDGKRDPGDIWYSSWIDNQWSAPVHAGSQINDRGYNAVAGLSADGMQLYLLSHYDPAGPAKTQGISISKKSASGWSKPENVFIPYFQNKSSIQSGYISPDFTVFIYSAETYGSYGVDDIYFCIRGSDGKWSEPKNVGTKINTQFQELSPSLSADKKILYFSSNGRRGLGSFDIYSSSRLDETFTNWSDPVNMGSEINSEGRELYYTSFEHLGLALYTSTRNSDGYGDIKFKISEKSKPDTIFVVQTPIAEEHPIDEEKINEEIPSNSVKIYGRVTNARSGEVISAKIGFVSTDAVQSVTSNGSGYSVTVADHKKYHVDLEAPGYISALENIDLQNLEINSLEMNFSLQPIAVGTTVNLKNVLFIQSKPELLPESYPELDLVVSFMNANPHVTIELAGHTDNRGSFRQLMDLSQKRVNRVKDYMVSKGIDKKRITGRGYGGSKPIASNDTEEQRILNRRVEFIIKKL